ncbi:hypothetical protein QE152_g38246 [Popillia japonica]|uniref:Integrase catalytic domain-containing protein n=1 Tax=Popillia japonica TaxID=7064 RepID=A0AAW1I772_POPJA
MTVDEASAMMQAISTHKGVYKVKRLMFGIKTAPGAWQRYMDQILQDLEGVVCFPGAWQRYMDQILQDLEGVKFLEANGIQHKVTAPYHPATNGQAERYVQTIKRSLRCQLEEKNDFKLSLYRFLIQYRKTPNATTHISPAELMFNRTIRTKLDLVRRDVSLEMNEKQRLPPESSKEFKTGDKVQFRNYHNPTRKWNFGTITRRTGLLHYEVASGGQSYKEMEFRDYHSPNRTTTLRSSKWRSNA